MSEQVRRGYKVVWRTADGEVVSLNADVLPGVGRRYELDQPVEPAPGAGPLFVLGGLQAISSAQALAQFHAMAIRDEAECVEVWEVDWLPWLEDGVDHSAPSEAAQERLPAGTRLARQVTLRRLVGRLRKGRWPRLQWERPQGNN